MICLLYWLTGFRGEYFKIFFPIVAYVKTMSAEGSHLGWRSGSLDTILKKIPLKDHPCHVCFKLDYWFQRRRFLNIFPIESYVKTMSADGGHLGWRSGSLDIILKVDHLRTIHTMFALNWLTGFRGKKIKHFPHRVLC
jgi:hypothetical protein